MYAIRRGIALALALLLIAVPAALTESSGMGDGGVFRFSSSDVNNTVFSDEPPKATQPPQAEATQPPQAEATQAAQQGGPEIPTATLSPKVAELPWNLMLVNKDNPVPGDWEADLVTLDNGRQVDRRILPDLQRMFDDCRRDGLKPTVYTAYRSYEDQEDMLKLKYRQYKNQGMSHTEAQIAALKVANYPGYSEHQLGLAVDIDSANTEVCSNESVWNWMKRHCQDYGFVWRYPSQKTDITGINNEDWHFRYVGVEAATYMMANHLCLEEYLQQFYDIPY